MSSSAAPLALTIDTTAPAPTTIGETSGLGFTGAAASGDTVTFSSGGTVLGSTIATAGTWSFLPTAIAAGTYALTATVTDPAGNTSPASPPANVAVAADHSFTVTSDTAGVTEVRAYNPAGSLVSDTITLDAPAALALAPTSDSGVLGDGITGVAQPAITGTAAPGSTIALFDGAVQIGTGVAAASGAFAVTPTAALSQGLHTLTATATDATGDLSAASAPLSLTIDTAVPAATSISQTATGGFTGTAEPGSTVSFSSGGTVLGSTAVNAGGAWSFLPSSLPAGSYALTAKVIDTAGNTSPASAALAVTVAADHSFTASTDVAGITETRAYNAADQLLSDTFTPDAPSALALAPASDTGTIGDGITSVTQPAITGTAAPGSSITFYDGNTPIGSATAGASGAFSVTPTAALAAGAHSLTAIATIAGGAASAVSAPLVLAIDTTAPAPTSIGETAGGLAGAATAGDTVSFSSGGTVVGSTVANAAGAWAFEPSILATGSYALTAAVTDVAGNTSPPSAAVAVAVAADHSFTVTTDSAGTTEIRTYDANDNLLSDTSTPDAPSGLALSPSSDSGAPGADVTSVAQPVVTGSAAPGSTITLFNGATSIGSAVADSTGVFAVAPASPLASGTYSLTATAADASGDVSAVSAPLVLTLETTAPGPTTIGESPTAGLTGQASPGSTITFVSGGTVVGSAVTDASGTWDFLPSSLAAGTYNLTAIVTDAAGESSVPSASLAVIVAPTQAFVVTMPESATAGQPAVTVTQDFSGSGILTETDITNAAGLLLQSVTPTATIREIYDITGKLIGTISEAGSATGAAPPDFTTAGLTGGATTTSDGTGSVVDLLSEGNNFDASGNDSISGGAGDDTISAGSHALSVAGGAGLLVFFGGTGTSTVTGGAGSATLIGGSAGGLYQGGQTVGNELFAGGGNTTLLGGSGHDILAGGPGASTIVGSTGGADTLVAGGGSNILLPSNNELVFAETGVSTVYGSAAGGNVFIGGGQDVMLAGGGNDELFAGDGGSTTMFGGSGSDLLAGGAGSAMIVAGSGTDFLYAGSGSSTMTGGSGTDIFAGGSGNAMMVAGANASVFVGGSGAETVFGSTGNDTVWTGAGQMSLLEGGGADDIVLQSGSAVLFGGSGKDIYFAADGLAGGSDVISGFKVGTDQIKLLGYGGAYSQQSSGGSTTLGLADGTVITLVGVTHLATTSVLTG